MAGLWGGGAFDRERSPVKRLTLGRDDPSRAVDQCPRAQRQSDHARDDSIEIAVHVASREIDEAEPARSEAVTRTLTHPDSPPRQTLRRQSESEFPDFSQH